MAWSLGKRIRIARVQRGVSQQALATAIGIGQSHLSAIERDGSSPSAHIIRHLALALRVRGDYLLGLSQRMDQDPTDEIEAEYMPADREQVPA